MRARSAKPSRTSRRFSKTSSTACSTSPRRTAPCTRPSSPISRDVATIFGFDEADFERIAARHVRRADDPYLILEADRSHERRRAEAPLSPARGRKPSRTGRSPAACRRRPSRSRPSASPPSTPPGTASRPSGTSGDGDERVLRPGQPGRDEGLPLAQSRRAQGRPAARACSSCTTPACRTRAKPCNGCAIRSRRSRPITSSSRTGACCSSCRKRAAPGMPASRPGTARRDINSSLHRHRDRQSRPSRRAAALPRGADRKR